MDHAVRVLGEPVVVDVRQVVAQLVIALVERFAGIAAIQRNLCGRRAAATPNRSEPPSVARAFHRLRRCCRPSRAAW